MHELFTHLDFNRDERIDINELGRATYGFYKSVLDNTQVMNCWKKLTNLDYITLKDLRNTLYSLSSGDEPAVQQILRDLNKENYDTVTLWQVIRAQGKTGYRIFIEMIEYCKTDIYILVKGNNDYSLNNDTYEDLLDNIQPRQEFNVLKYEVEEKHRSTQKLIMSPGSPDISFSNTKIKEFSDLIPLRELQGFRRTLALHKIDCVEMSKYLKHQLKKFKGRLDLEKFTQLIAYFKPSNLDTASYQDCIGFIFNFLDYSRNRSVGKADIANLFILLSAGNSTRKNEAAFLYYDRRADGTLDIKELTNYFTAALKLKWRTCTKFSQNSREKVDLIAAAYANKMFKATDLDKNGVISYEEFAYYLNHQRGLARDPTAPKTTPVTLTIATENAAPKQAVISNPNFNDKTIKAFNDIKRSLPLNQIHISICLAILKKRHADFSAITKEAFQSYLTDLLKTASIVVQFDDAYFNMVKLFFEIFDQNNSGILDKYEVHIGLFLLAGGTFREKLTAVSRVFDDDNDQFLSRSELANFFSYFYSFMGFREEEKKINREVLGETLGGRILKKYSHTDAGITLDTFSTLEPIDFNL